MLGPAVSVAPSSRGEQIGSRQREHRAGFFRIQEEVVGDIVEEEKGVYETVCVY